MKPMLLATLALVAACGPGAPATPTFTTDVRPILSANCVRCHGATPSGGAPAGFRLDRYGFRAGRRGAGDVAPFLAERVRQGDMPRFSPGLAGYQIDTLSRWVEQGENLGGAVVTALGPMNGAPTIALDEPLPAAPVSGALGVRLRFDDPDGDAAWAKITARGDFGEPFVVADDLETGRPLLALDLDTFPAGTTTLEAELGDDGGNTVTVDLGALTIVRDGTRAPRTRWARPSTTPLLHTSRPAIVALDAAHAVGSDFQLAVDDDGLADARVVTLTATLGDVSIVLPAAVDGVVTWPLDDVPAGTSWRLTAVVDDGTFARSTTTIPFVIADGTTTETYDAIAADILVPVCGKCHIVGDEVNVLVPVDLRASNIKSVLGLMVRKVVQLEEMPPVSAETLFDVHLTAEQRARVASWLDGGAPGGIP